MKNKLLKYLVQNLHFVMKEKLFVVGGVGGGDMGLHLCVHVCLCVCVYKRVNMGRVRWEEEVGRGGQEQEVWG